MKTIAVWFSCGAASAVAAKKTIEQYGDTHNIRIINNPVEEEDVDNHRFLLDVEKWLGVPIESASNSKYPTCSAVDVWEKRQFMSGPHGAPCTLELKKMARQQYEMDHDIDLHVLGFTSEERGRFENFRDNERENTIHVLGYHNITKGECFQILNDAGIKLPRIYEDGYPNANCIGCVKATSPTYWNLVRAKHPVQFQQRAEQSRRIEIDKVQEAFDKTYTDLNTTLDEITGKKKKNG